MRAWAPATLAARTRMGRQTVTVPVKMRMRLPTAARMNEHSTDHYKPWYGTRLPLMSSRACHRSTQRHLSFARPRMRDTVWAAAGCRAAA